MNKIAEMYDAVAQDYSSMVEWTKYVGPKWLVEKLTALDSSTSVRVLDLGCADGIHIPALRSYFQSVEAVAVDISPNMILCAKSSGNYTDCIVSDLDREFPDVGNGCFEIVMALGFLEFLTRPLRCLKEIAGSLKPGGSCFLSFQLHDPSDPLKPRKTRSGDVVHHAQTREEVEHLMGQAGLTLCSAEEHIGYVSGPGFECPYLMVVGMKK